MKVDVFAETHVLLELIGTSSASSGIAAIAHYRGDSVFVGCLDISLLFLSH